MNIAKQRLLILALGFLVSLGLSSWDAPSAHAIEALDLDQVIQDISSQQTINPFVKGDKAAFRHPIYPVLDQMAADFGSVIKWVPSVSAEVLNLPFVADRMKVQPSDEFNGWFDEYEVPNLIIVHKKASLVTLVHELRHALHIGVHGRIQGNTFDQEIQLNRVKIKRFHDKLLRSPMDTKTKTRLKYLSTRLLETCSEISAHHGDLLLAEAFKNREAKDHRRFIEEYRSEFLKSYRALSRHPFSQSEEFVEGLNQSLTASGL